MNPYDAPVPEDDAIARAALRTLGALAHPDAPGHLSWETVRSCARRVQRRRVAAVGAASAIVLLGATAAVASAGHNDRDGARAAGLGSPTSSASEPSSTPTQPWDSSSAAGTTIGTPPGIPEGDDGSATVPTTLPTDPTIATTTTQVVLQPNEGSWRTNKTTVDKPVVAVGETFVVTVELTNTGTQLQTTIGYSSYGVACLPYPLTEVREGLPVGHFFSEAPVMQPGETHTFSVTFQAEATWVGTLWCGSGYAYHGDDFAAFGYPTVEVEVVAGPDPATTTTTTTTTTTIAAP